MDTSSSDIKPPSAVERRWLATALHVLIILTALAGFAALRWVINLPNRLDAQQTIIVGPTLFAPDSDASVRVVVQDFSAGQPIPGAQVKVSLQGDSGPA